MSPQPILTNRFFLTAGETDARGEMPVTLIAERLIEVATNHANLLGIGYASLAPKGVGWVLTRMAYRMERLPKINESYEVTTWIESWNRMFSQRCFKFSDSNGNTIGWARTIWVIIDIDTRRPADLRLYGSEDMINHDMVCPLPKMENHKPIEVNCVEEYTFRYSDLDFNRHVNSVRYIEHILNLWEPRHYDRFCVDGFEIAYRHECLGGQTVQFVADKSDLSSGRVEIVHNGERMVTCSLHFKEDPLK